MMVMVVNGRAPGGSQECIHLRALGLQKNYAIGVLESRLGGSLFGSFQGSGK